MTIIAPQYKNCWQCFYNENRNNSVLDGGLMRAPVCKLKYRNPIGMAFNPSALYCRYINKKEIANPKWGAALLEEAEWDKNRSRQANKTHVDDLLLMFRN
jgi:hypothetical protein